MRHKLLFKIAIVAAFGSIIAESAAAAGHANATCVCSHSDFTGKDTIDCRDDSGRFFCSVTVTGLNCPFVTLRLTCETFVILDGYGHFGVTFSSDGHTICETLTSNSFIAEEEPAEALIEESEN